ncbi:MAG: DUF748 domain-containing protein [Candidatus Omnitrophota bacterium]
MKKIGLFLLAVIVIVGGIVFYYRYEIFQFSGEAIIMKNLPSYVTVEGVKIDLRNGTLHVKGFGLRNPEGYYNKFLARIGNITCKFQRKGQRILDGIEVTEITADAPVINLERRSSGNVNIQEMEKVMSLPVLSKKTQNAGGMKKEAIEQTKEQMPEYEDVENRDVKPVMPAEISEKTAVQVLAKGEDKTGTTKRKSNVPVVDIFRIIKLTDTINIKDGEIIFWDHGLPGKTIYKISIREINADLIIDLSDDFKKVLSVASKGEGTVQADKFQKIKWDISLDPTSSKLTMSNKYEVQDLDITIFEPYYDKYSPVIIGRGTASGNFVFNFDNGDIGSTNTLYLSDLVFAVKRNYSGGYWGVGIPELVRYLQSSSGEIVFDFKIKGNMENPRFYPGDKVKKALQKFVVEKISSALQNIGGGDDSEGGGDVEKVVDFMKGIFN